MGLPLPDHAVTGVVLFGKLPAHGDFVARGLGADARDRLDAWLAAAVAAARQAHGEAFAERWDRAPPWRFVRPVAAGWQAGVVAPSVDRVGRRFPVLLARAADGGDAAALAGALEGLVATAVAAGWDGDRLAEAAAAAVPPGAATAVARWWVADATDGEVDGFAPAAGPDAWPADLLVRMLGVAA